MTIQTPTQGRIVLYSAKMAPQEDAAKLELRTYPALITSVEADGSVNLVVFYDHKVRQDNFGHPTAVPYSEKPKDHSWQFIDGNAIGGHVEISGTAAPVVVAAPKKKKKAAKKRR